MERREGEAWKSEAFQDPQLKAYSHDDRDVDTYYYYWRQYSAAVASTVWHWQCLHILLCLGWHYGHHTCYDKGNSTVNSKMATRQWEEKDSKFGPRLLSSGLNISTFLKISAWATKITIQWYAQ